MKPFTLLLAFALWCSACAIHAQTPDSESTKSKADLINDIRLEFDREHKSEAARRIAVQTHQIDVIAAGITASSYNTRTDCIKSLSLFPVDQQKQALVTALGKDAAWEEEFPGESREAQETVCQQIADVLKGFGITAIWKDLLNPAARKNIVNQLVPAK